MEKNEEPLGIPSSGYEYMNLLPEQMSFERRLDEFHRIREFLRKIANSNTVREFQGKGKNVQFINYGDTQLVYVLTVGERKYTMLLGQPATKFGVVKQEYENLRLLGKNNKKNVVVPMHYFKDEENKHELYITPYLYQARCIGVEDRNWGAWIPEPEYNFKEFSQEERSIINSSMIALLVNFFDTKNNLGIGACRLGGGDFILEKGYENEKITYENILKRMKLIAARELIPISFDEYLKRLKEEFSIRTYYRSEEERDKSILINHKSRIPMSLEEIENGIKIGYKLREEQNKEIIGEKDDI